MVGWPQLPVLTAGFRFAVVDAGEPSPGARIDMTKSEPASAPAAELPPAPADHPDVVKAKAVVTRLEQEVEQAKAALAAAEEALAAHREQAAEQLVDRLAEGEEPGTDDTRALLVAVETARVRLDTAGKAVDLARLRRTRALEAAKQAFGQAMRPFLLAALDEAGQAAAAAVQVNERLRKMAEFAAGHGAFSSPWSIVLPLPEPEKLPQLLEARRRSIDPPPPVKDPNRIAVRLLVSIGSINPGEITGYDIEKARDLIRGIYAEPVDPADMQRLGIKVTRFDRPQWVRLHKDFVSAHGTISLKDTVQQFDALTASRAVTLGFGETVGESHA
jgi:hypothetical protein